MPRDVTDFLTRTVLDDDFRATAIRDPESAFSGYDLSDEEREVLRSGDERMLALMGKALRHAWGSHDDPRLPESPEEAGEDDGDNSLMPPSTQAMPNSHLRLRLTPQVMQGADGRVQINYAANLFPWAAVPPSSDPAGIDAGGAAAAATFVDMKIAISPTLFANADGTSSIAYAASIGHSTQTEIAGDTLEVESMNRHESLEGRIYHSDSSAALEAAAKVREVSANDRYPEILNLITALREGDIDG